MPTIYFSYAYPPSLFESFCLITSINHLEEPLIIPDLSLPSRIKYGVNSGGSPVMSKTSEFLLSQKE